MTLVEISIALYIFVGLSTAVSLTRYALMHQRTGRVATGRIDNIWVFSTLALGLLANALLLLAEYH